MFDESWTFFYLLCSWPLTSNIPLLWNNKITHLSVFITEAWDDFPNVLWAYSWNLMKIHCAVILILMVQSGQNFAHAMIAQLSWHVQKFDLMGLLFFM